jgi:hypothetical protein
MTEHGLGGRHVTSLLCEDLANGNGKIRVRARQYVVAAGAFASSGLLRRSDIGNAGKQFSANVVTSVFGRMPSCFPPGPSQNEKRPNPGIQMSLWVAPDSQHNRLLETWFHYPGSIAGSLPGWLEDHSRVMAGYGKLAGCGVVIPTANHGYLNGVNLVLGLSGDEFLRMKAGIPIVDSFVEGGNGGLPCTTRPFVFHADTIAADKTKYTPRSAAVGPRLLHVALQEGNPDDPQARSQIVGRGLLGPSTWTTPASPTLAFPGRSPRQPVMLTAPARLAAARVMDSLTRQPNPDVVRFEAAIGHRHA